MPVKSKNNLSTRYAAGLIGLTTLSLASFSCAQETQPTRWKMGTPLITYFAGPPMTDASAKQMADGGFNLVWTPESGITKAQQYGLRWMLQTPLLNPRTAPHVFDDAVKYPQLQALIARVKNNPQHYGYYLIDEPTATQFEEIAKTVAYLRKESPGSLAYVNLYPIYATTKQLGVPEKGNKVANYKEYVRQYIETVKPDLLSYDHYHFHNDKDGMEYFLNLGLVRQAALDAGLPFMNIIQASKYGPEVRAPKENELRWLNNTTLAYGGQGISYFVYHVASFYQKYSDDPGQMMKPDGSPTPQYEAAKQLNPQFAAIASQLQSLRSLGAYHIGKEYEGTQKLPANTPFNLQATSPNGQEAGMLLGYFGTASKPDVPSHVFVVNLDYRNTTTTTLTGPGKLSTFNAVERTWTAAGGAQVTLTLPPGGGMLVRQD
jgi:hypothetical protein